MKVLYVGYPKCGTKSMTAVFRTLGYTCYDNPEHIILLADDWKRVFKEGVTPDDLRKMYSGVDAAVATPVYRYWEEFLEAFPDLKLIVSYRDDQEWLKSALRQMEAMKKDRSMQVLSLLSPTAQKFMSVTRSFNRCFFGGSRYAFPWQFGIEVNQSRVLQDYQRHNFYVQHKAPKDRLLVVDFKEGWGPICKFLGKPIPDEPFPHANKAAVYLKQSRDEHPLFHKMKTEAKTTASILTALFSILIFYILLK